MHKFLLIAAALASSSAAQAASTVTMFLPGPDPSQTVIGSVMASDKDKTTYSITCELPRPTSFCVFGDNFHITVEPSTAKIIQTVTVEESMSASLASASVTGVSEVLEATCTSSNAMTLECTGGVALVSGSSTLSSSSFVETVANATSYLFPVTLTDKLGGPTATPTGGSASASATSSKPNAGGPRATQNAVLAGAAAILGGAVLL